MSPSFRLLLVADIPTFAAAGVDVAEHLRRLPEDAQICVLFRHKDAPLGEQRALLSSLVTAAPHVKWLVHTHTALLEVAGDRALGVHLDGRADARCRPDIGDDLVVTVSRHADDALDQRALAGVDAILLSPVFAPTSKPNDRRPALGTAELRRQASSSSKPIFALGGVTPANAAEVLATGAHGVAVLGAWVQNPRIVDDLLTCFAPLPTAVTV